MAEKILKTRIQISSTIRNELWKWVQAESVNTDVPISKILDRAIEAYQAKQSSEQKG